MKNKSLRFWILAVAVLLIVTGVVIYRQVLFNAATGKLYDLLKPNQKVAVKETTEELKSSEFLKKYYEKYGYQMLWTDTSGMGFRQMLIQMLAYADSLGLNPDDYHAAYVHKYDSLVKLKDYNVEDFVTENEVIFTDAAMSFLFHVAYGREIKTGYDGIKYNIDSTRIIQSYNQLLSTRNWRSVLDSIEPRIAEYLLLKNKLNYMKAFLRDFPELDTLKAGDSESGRIAAALKLRFYGFIADSLTGDTSDAIHMRNALAGFQRMMNVDTTGLLDKRSIALLNMPMQISISRISESLNYWRWTGRLAESEFILINLPAARLRIVNRDSSHELSMRVIVGKSTTPTPQFTAYISRVITYPYWNVPQSIATKEMLPKIKKNIGYLEANNLQVLNAAGKEIDPAKVKWKKLSEHRFPYRLRQSTGCDNALGVLKFDINSPYSIYLHDTNRRDLFSRKDRFMSHGCVRVEKPFELANYILRDGIDSVTLSKLSQCLQNEEPSSFKLSKKFPVLIFYMTADVDENGLLRFYNDVYGIEEKERREV